MAVMINSMGGGSDLRGTVHLKEFKTDVVGELTEVVNLEGPGRLLFAFATRMQNSSGSPYSSVEDNIYVEIIPDGDETKTLKKTYGDDDCTSSGHLAVRPLMQALSFPELSQDFIINRYGIRFIYSDLNPETVACTSTRSLHSSGSINMTFAGSAEGIADGVEDTSVTLYPDGMFFDDSLVIRGRWGRSLTRDFNGVILAYQIFD